MQEEQKLCEYGCGQVAKFKFKNGKWCCGKSYNSCQASKKKVSIKSFEEWKTRNRSDVFKKKERIEKPNPGFCEYGCGLEAKHRLKNGKWCCSEKHNSCLGSRKINSERIKQLYKEGRIKGWQGLSKERRNLGWAKGLTKYTDERIRKTGEKLKYNLNNGITKPSFLGKHHTLEARKKQAKGCKVRHSGGRGHKGWYKGFWCDSSWELAFVIYNLDHGIKFERNLQGFEYKFNDIISKFYPDFILNDGTYIEIKGWFDDRTKEKISQFKNPLLIIGKNNIKPYLDYVHSKYGRDFINLYDKKIMPSEPDGAADVCKTS